MSNNTEIVRIGSLYEIYIVCPKCEIDMVHYNPPTDEEIMEYKVNYHCSFCDKKFTSNTLVQMKRKIKIKRLCGNMKK